jgi:hypothetical protein
MVHRHRRAATHAHRLSNGYHTPGHVLARIEHARTTIITTQSGRLHISTVLSIAKNGTFAYACLVLQLQMKYSSTATRRLKHMRDTSALVQVGSTSTTIPTITVSSSPAGTSDVPHVVEQKRPIFTHISQTVTVGTDQSVTLSAHTRDTVGAFYWTGPAFAQCDRAVLKLSRLHIEVWDGKGNC